jgi:hypothetical protein
MNRHRTSSRLPVLSAALLTVLSAGCALQAPPAGEELYREAYGEVVPPAAWTGATTAACSAAPAAAAATAPSRSIAAS